MSTRPTWVEISLTQLAENYRIIRKHIGAERAVMAIVKADAYGHGLAEIAKALARLGVDWFGVTSADEGVELRQLGLGQPILLLTGFWEGEQSALTDYDLVPAIYSEDQLATLEAWGRRTGKRLRFHLKVNTGMGMLGLHWHEVDRFLESYRQMTHVEMEGLFEQFAAAEDFTTRQTEEQMERFQQVEQALDRAGISPRFRHQANSAAIVSRPESWGNMVRPGLLLYGYQPPVRVPEGSQPPAFCSLPVREILTYKTKIISIKQVPAGISMGYGGRYVTPRNSRIATIPAGYADGVNRKLSGRGRVIICGQYAPIFGTISMDLTLVDVTDFPQLGIGEEVILIGHKGEYSQSALDIAETVGTIPYEILCGIGKRVPRRYVP
ncbi:MAG: alanine racemase [Acidobacteria bacterium RIFCSPLOWO2_02_FULL_59_13]|nr:MAG: alanine racemase [Acidobacteria bacterium RIFCSPLOWO2_02_FULL_59_13]